MRGGCPFRLFFGERECFIPLDSMTRNLTASNLHMLMFGRDLKSKRARRPSAKKRSQSQDPELSDNYESFVDAKFFELLRKNFIYKKKSLISTDCSIK